MLSHISASSCSTRRLLYQLFICHKYAGLIMTQMRCGCSYLRTDITRPSTFEITDHLQNNLELPPTLPHASSCQRPALGHAPSTVGNFYLPKNKKTTFPVRKSCRSSHPYITLTFLPSFIQGRPITEHRSLAALSFY